TKLNKVKGQKKAVKVTWKKQAKKMSVKRITGYQIQLSTRKDFETYRLVTVKGYKNTSKTVKKLKAKKKYYVRVRTYFQCKDGFKSYSTWSKAKTVKTK
ncbi:MAG: fibronectin type III domain-containing protein, partial [Eubacterium sp.]|nr:fibronectin type III domain-containing protein [Eubacterium sp.]